MLATVSPSWSPSRIVRVAAVGDRRATGIAPRRAWRTRRWSPRRAPSSARPGGTRAGGDTAGPERRTALGAARCRRGARARDRRRPAARRLGNGAAAGGRGARAALGRDGSTPVGDDGARGTTASTTGSSARRRDARSPPSTRPRSTDAASSITRSAHVETPAPWIRRVADAHGDGAAHDDARGARRGVAHDERERRRRREPRGGEPVEHERGRVAVGELRPQRGELGGRRRRRRRGSLRRERRRATPLGGSCRYVAIFASPVARRRVLGGSRKPCRGGRASSRRRRRIRARTRRRSAVTLSRPPCASADVDEFAREARGVAGVAGEDVRRAARRRPPSTGRRSR